MDLKQLAALTAVAEHRSFSAAARSLHTVQSNVSAHVAKLESELEAVLVDRSDCSLTPAGELVTARAHRIRAELDALGGDLASTAQSVVGPVRLGMIGTTARWLVPRLLPEVTRLHPRIHLTIIDATTTSLIPQLIDGRLDLAVVNLPVHSQDVTTIELFDEGLVVVAPLDHPLCAHASVDLDDLAEYRLLLPPTGTSFRDELDAAAGAASVSLTPAAEVDGVRLLATLAFEGFGAAIVPTSAAAPRPDAAWQRIPIRGIAPRGVGLATGRRALPSNASRAVGSIVESVCERWSPQHVAFEGTSDSGEISRPQH